MNCILLYLNDGWVSSILFVFKIVYYFMFCVCILIVLLMIFKVFFYLKLKIEWRILKILIILFCIDDDFLNFLFMILF